MRILDRSSAREALFAYSAEKEAGTTSCSVFPLGSPSLGCAALVGRHQGMELGEALRPFSYLAGIEGSEAEQEIQMQTIGTVLAQARE